MKDTMLSDGLTDAFNDYHMGITGTVCDVTACIYSYYL